VTPAWTACYPPHRLREAFLYVTTVGDLRNGAVWYMGREGPTPPVVVGLEVPAIQ